MSSPSSADPGGRGKRAPQRVALIGSTGSIGRQTVDVLAALPDAFRVIALAAGANAALLAEQADRLRPAAIALADADDMAAWTCRPARNGSADRMPSSSLPRGTTSTSWSSEPAAS